MDQFPLARQGMSVKDGSLYIEDISCQALADQFGLPIYVYSQSTLEKNMRAFKSAFTSKEIDCQVAYASKAFNCMAILKLAQKEGLWADIVSAGELYTAKKAGFDMQHVIFHGNNKSMEELKMALEYNVGTIVADHIAEVKDLCTLAETIQPKNRIRILLRINPGIEAHTHDFIMTASPDSKFGINKECMDEIIDIAKAAGDSQYLIFNGFHAHIGSQIFQPESFMQEIDSMMEFIASFEEKSGLKISTLDLGGGFAAFYARGDEPIDIKMICHAIIERVLNDEKKLDIQLKNLWIEPGRSIVGNAGCTLYSVDHIKKTPNRTYYFVNGGMSDNIRPALYGSEYTCDLCNRMDQEKTEEVAIAGKACESGDILIQKTLLPKADTPDLLVTYTTGAYGYSMASHYNKLPVPGVVFVKDDKARWVIKPESLEDLISKEVLEEDEA